jgi:hypothetical protein
LALLLLIFKLFSVEELEEEEMGAQVEGEENVELKAREPPAVSPMHAPTIGNEETFDDDAFDVDEIQAPVRGVCVEGRVLFCWCVPLTCLVLFVCDA